MNESWLDAIEDFTANPPTLVIVSAATWTIKQTNGSADGLAQWKNAFGKWAAKANEYLETKPGTKLIWELQDPVQEEELDPWRAAITNEIIDEYNMAALEILKDNTDIWVWSSGRLVTQVNYNMRAKVPCGNRRLN